jgi:hypothetical protein
MNVMTNDPNGTMARTLSARVKSEIGGGAAAKEGQPGVPR